MINKLIAPILLGLISCSSINLAAGHEYKDDNFHRSVELRESDKYTSGIIGYADIGDDYMWYAGLMFPIEMAIEDLYLNLSFAPGYYNPDDGDDGISFRSGAELSYPISYGLNWTLGYTHMSDADISDVPSRDSVLFGLRFSF
jgi:hypothetical protein